MQRAQIGHSQTLTRSRYISPYKLVHALISFLCAVFDPDKEWSSEDAAITSIYFDNEELDLYLGRLEKTEGAQAIRLRWYGGMGVKQVFVERKTHREDWTGEKSVKARFPIKEDQVNRYLAGELNMGEIFETEGKKKGKKQSDIDNNTKLAREVQEAIEKKNLQPGKIIPARTGASSKCFCDSYAHILQSNCLPVTRGCSCSNFARH